MPLTPSTVIESALVATPTARTDLLCWRAVSFEGAPLPFVFAVNDKELLDVQGL